ncbi:MAG: signal peptidase [Verrucomicrobiota bacterium]|jgi:signal peptidase II
MTALSPNRLIARVAGIIFLADQFTKLAVLKYLNFADEKIIVPGFFKFVHWGNTGAAWSLFTGRNGLLAAVALAALVALWFARRHFGAHTRLGQLALGLIFGGIVGNLLDRLLPARQHVVDFLYFFIQTGGREHGFPAFNVADSAICTGVSLIFLLNWKGETPVASPSEPK